MNRSIGFLIAVLALPFPIIQVVCAQDIRGRAFASEQPPKLPSDILGPRMIVWSQQQQPEPVQQAVTDPPVLQTFTGTIVKMQGAFVLSLANDASYILEESKLGELKGMDAYEGKQVRIQGTLDADILVLQVKSIEIIS